MYSYPAAPRGRMRLSPGLLKRQAYWRSVAEKRVKALGMTITICIPGLPPLRQKKVARMGHGRMRAAKGKMQVLLLRSLARPALRMTSVRRMTAEGARRRTHEPDHRARPPAHFSRTTVR